MGDGRWAQDGRSPPRFCRGRRRRLGGGGDNGGGVLRLRAVGGCGASVVQRGRTGQDRDGVEHEGAGLCRASAATHPTGWEKGRDGGRCGATKKRPIRLQRCAQDGTSLGLVEVRGHMSIPNFPESGVVGWAPSLLSKASKPLGMFRVLEQSEKKGFSGGKIRQTRLVQRGALPPKWPSSHFKLPLCSRFYRGKNIPGCLLRFSC